MLSHAARVRLIAETIDASLVNNLQIAQQLAPNLDKFLEALEDAALGVRMYKQEDFGDGPVERTYTRAPDVKALRLVLELCNAFPALVATMLLAIEKAREADVKARIGPKQGKFLEAQTRKTEQEANAYSLSFITDDTLRELVNNVMMSGIRYAQSVSREDFLKEFGDSDEKYRLFVDRLGKAMVAAVKEALPGEEDETEKKAARAKALPAKFTEDTE